MILVVEIISTWLFFSFLTLGTYIAYFDGMFRSLDDYRGALSGGILFSLLFGPLGTLLSCFLSDFYRYGWRILPVKKAC